MKVHDAGKGAAAQELTGAKQPDKGWSGKGQGVRGELPEGGFAALLEAGEGADGARAGVAEREVVAGREAALEALGFVWDLHAAHQQLEADDSALKAGAGELPPGWEPPRRGRPPLKRG